MKIRSRWVNIVLSYLGTACMRVLFLTVRVDHRSVHPDATPYREPRGVTRYTFSLWHDYIVTAVFALKTWKLAGLISQHRDGSYLADSVLVAGIQPVRGSTSRGGMEAVREILAMPDHHLAMTPDGPRGPRRVMKEGIIYIASRSGRPVVPTAIVASRCWMIPGNWTNMLMPKPFSRALLISGRPVTIPDDLPRDVMADWAAGLQAEMERLEAVATRIISGEANAATKIDCDWAASLPRGDAEHDAQRSAA